MRSDSAAGSLSDGAAEKPWRRLRPGMVLTIEPGIYVRAADDVPKAFHDIGIRIEDDALITEAGCELLTSDVPKAAADIEALMTPERPAKGQPKRQQKRQQKRLQKLPA
jgi:Xaa-Pro aminopeptidase